MTVCVVNSYAWAPKVIENYATNNNIAIPAGTVDPNGNAVCMDGRQGRALHDRPDLYPRLRHSGADRARRRLCHDLPRHAHRFGRYVYATGGNPEAAELAGINTKKITLMIFTLMGGLCAHLGLDLIGAPQLGDQRARPVRRALCDRRSRDRRHLARRRHGHDLRRHAWRAGHAVAAIGHGPARISMRPCSRWSSARCSCSPCSSTPSMASASSEGGDHGERRNRTPLVETSRPLDRLRRHQGRRSCQRRSLSRRSGRAAWPQRRRQVDADQDPVRRLQARRRRHLRQWRAGRHQQSARRQAIRHRDDLPDAGAGRQCRRRRQPLSRPRAADQMGHARRHRHGDARRAR